MINDSIATSSADMNYQLQLLHRVGYNYRLIDIEIRFMVKVQL